MKRLLATATLLPILSAPAFAAPETVVSIKPIHSLVGAAMEGVGEPTLLLPPGASPHTYALRPSDARHIGKAELIVWVGEELETFLRKPLSLRAGKARIVTLIEDADLELLTGGGDGDDEHHDDHGHAGSVDPHVWLDSRNARRIVDRVAAVLGELDPPNAPRYEANARRAGQQLMELDAEIHRILAPVRAAPYVVFHDAYRYFERRYGTNPVGAIALHPERQPGAGSLARIQRKIVETGARCVFSEPQFQPALVRTVIRGTDARSGVLDPLGTAAAPDGIEGYLTLMRQLAHSLRRCLS